MIKFILPAVLILLIIIFWEKITIFLKKKFNINLNLIVFACILGVILSILLLLNF